MTIIEGNKIIAEFMGGKLKHYSISNAEFYSGLTHGKQLMIATLKYHSSWDWIIPVYQKYLTCINKIDESNNGWFIIGHDIQDALLKADIKSLHSNLYEFIQWYKEQKAQVK